MKTYKEAEMRPYFLPPLSVATACLDYKFPEKVSPQKKWVRIKRDLTLGRSILLKSHAWKNPDKHVHWATSHSWAPASICRRSLQVISQLSKSEEQAPPTTLEAQPVSFLWDSGPGLCILIPEQPVGN